LYNYLDFAFGERPRSTKEALSAFWPNRPKKRVDMAKAQSSTITSEPELRFDLPITPLDCGGKSVNRDTEPAKKNEA